MKHYAALFVLVFLIQRFSSNPCWLLFPFQVERQILLILLRGALSLSGGPWGTVPRGLEGAMEPSRVRTRLLPFPSRLSVTAVIVLPSAWSAVALSFPCTGGSASVSTEQTHLWV